MMEDNLNVDGRKELRDANKYPRRSCTKCIRYPCFSGQGTDAHTVNFAAYGCVKYKLNHEICSQKPRKNKKYARRN